VIFHRYWQIGVVVVDEKEIERPVSDYETVDVAVAVVAVVGEDVAVVAVVAVVGEDVAAAADVVENDVVVEKEDR